MKKITTLAACVLALLGLYACNNDINKVFDNQTLIEFQPAVVNAASVGRTYPLLTVATSTTAGATIAPQLNLVGRQRSAELPVRVFVDPTSTASPSTYTIANGGVATFAAAGAPTSSTVAMTITVAKASSAAAPFGNLILVIDSTSTDYKPSQNYKRIGYTFRQ
ncbi:hypothetical protein [Fibrella arboris]|uniref:hypothetical protein n=1 Tax=Fibrella arboris TaxID=3242486 RepID=UPI00351F8C95